MSVYETKEFSRFARKEKISAKPLLRAATDVAQGQFDADLGGGVFKQRVARPGAGKSGGFRAILFFKVGRHTFFSPMALPRANVPMFQRRSSRH